MSPSASENPMSGEKRSPSMTSNAFSQWRSMPVLPKSQRRAIFTPKIDPISAWELDTGSASLHAPRSQIIAETRIEMIIIIPNVID